jgi:hypothetical protein
MNFFAEELFHGQPIESDLVFDEKEPNADQKDPSATDILKEELEFEEADEAPNCFEVLHSRFAPSRSLKSSFFDEEIFVRIFLSVFAVCE